jgi:hypothetical protein
MRDSGYRDAAHALAELVDNSVQAGARNVEIICLDKIEFVQQRTRRRIDRIAVFDDGCGMGHAVLQIALQFGNGTHLTADRQNGIGKFGMGLPNSSISQCQRVDVWSWQEGQVLYSYLDVEEIAAGKLKTVPIPVPRALPDEIIALLKTEVCQSGTLVLWSGLDRVRWKGSKALLDNSEFLIGRMYRYFLENDRVKIRLAALAPDPSRDWQVEYEQYVQPNDPLYLMRWTSCPPLPEPYGGEASFEEYGPPQELSVQLPGSSESHTVAIRFSIVKRDLRKRLGKGGQSPGATDVGKHMGKNIGISIVRAGRELEMSRAHVIGYDPVERWWGIEVSFPPALDEIFGVTNNKQAATAFAELNLDEDAAAEGMKAQEFFEELKKVDDPRWVLYEVSRRIHANLAAMRKQLSRMSEGQRQRAVVVEVDPAEMAATQATVARQQEGYVGKSDEEEDLSPEERTQDLQRKLEELGKDPGEAKEIAVSHVTAGIKYVFQQTPYEGASFFTVSSRGGSIIVNVNKEHPVARYLLELLESSENSNGNRALTALKLMLCAWARLEDETQNDKQRQRYVDIRDEWGRMTRDFLSTAYED